MADYLEEQISTVFIDGQVTEFIEYQGHWFQVLFQLLLELPASWAADKLLITSIAVVNSTVTPCKHAVYARAVAKWVFPSPTPPRKMTFALFFTKSSLKRFYTCIRLIFFGQFQRNPSKVLITGKQA